MQAWVDKALSEPLVMLALILVLGVIAYAILKRLFKWILIFGLGLALLTGYFLWTDRPAPFGVDAKLKTGAKKGAQTVKRTARKVGDEVRRTAQEETKKAIKEAREALED